MKHPPKGHAQGACALADANSRYREQLQRDGEGDIDEKVKAHAAAQSPPNYFVHGRPHKLFGASHATVSGDATQAYALSVVAATGRW